MRSRTVRTIAFAPFSLLLRRGGWRVPALLPGSAEVVKTAGQQIRVINRRSWKVGIGLANLKHVCSGHAIVVRLAGGIHWDARECNGMLWDALGRAGTH